MTAIYPNFERPLSGADDFDGNFLSSAIDQLDHIAKAIGLPTLTSLIDGANMADAYLDDEEGSRIDLTDVAWHSPNAGLALVRGLVNHIEETDVRVRTRLGDKTDRVIAELKELEQLLVEAEKQSNRFHLLVDI